MDPLRVLAHYPHLHIERLEPLGNRGGFSGASLWRVHTPDEILCLRCCAPHETAEHLRFRHALMHQARREGVFVVPMVYPTREIATFVSHRGRFWELQQWLPGTADFHTFPSREKLLGAVEMLARLHRIWGVARSNGPCPGVLRRLNGIKSRQQSEHQTITTDSLVYRLQSVLRRWLGRIPELLRTAPAQVSLQPCLRDIWHDHLLFTGEHLTGIVDYAAMGPDHVAVDLARMLGSLIEDDHERWREAIEAYRGMCSLSKEEEQLARTLDRTGVILALANWHTRLQEEETVVGRDDQTNRRIERLLNRVERW